MFKKGDGGPGSFFCFPAGPVLRGRCSPLSQLLKTFQYGWSVFISGKSAKNSDTDLKLFYNRRTKKSSGFS